MSEPDTDNSQEDFVTDCNVNVLVTDSKVNVECSNQFIKAFTGTREGIIDASSPFQEIEPVLIPMPPSGPLIGTEEEVSRDLKNSSDDRDNASSPTNTIPMEQASDTPVQDEMVVIFLLDDCFNGGAEGVEAETEFVILQEIQRCPRALVFSDNLAQDLTPDYLLNNEDAKSVRDTALKIFPSGKIPENFSELIEDQKKFLNKFGGCKTAYYLGIVGAVYRATTPSTPETREQDIQRVSSNQP